MQLYLCRTDFGLVAGWLLAPPRHPHVDNCYDQIDLQTPATRQVFFFIKPLLHLILLKYYIQHQRHHHSIQLNYNHHTPAINDAEHSMS